MSMRPAAPAMPTKCGTPEEMKELCWNDLTETEKSVASLGVEPTALKPIAFMSACTARAQRARSAHMARACVASVVDA
jgi:hypothetical protein